MSTNSMFSIMDVIVVVCGLYVIFQTVTMMKTGILTENSPLLPKDLNPRKCKDIAGFIKYIGMKQLILGILALLSGLIGLVQDYTNYLNNTVYLVGTVVLVAYLIFYAIDNRKAIKMFWDDMN